LRRSAHRALPKLAGANAHIAAVIALIVANLVAIFIFTMPAGMSVRATVLGAVTGIFPIAGSFSTSSSSIG
jgi:L-lactate permease